MTRGTRWSFITVFGLWKFFSSSPSSLVASSSTRTFAVVFRTKMISEISSETVQVCGDHQDEDDSSLWQLMILMESIDESESAILFDWCRSPTSSNSIREFPPRTPIGHAISEVLRIPNGHSPWVGPDCQIRTEADAKVHGQLPLDSLTAQSRGLATDDHQEASPNRGTLSRALLAYYVDKFRGLQGHARPRRDGIREIALSFFGSFTSMALFGAIDFYFLLGTRFSMLIPGFAAMAVILFTDIGSRGALAQPRNALFGHTLSAVIGTACRGVIPSEQSWLSAPLAIGLTIALMSLTHTVHPAAGATALACVYGPQVPRIAESAWWFVLMPVALGSIAIVLITIIVNNLSPRRRYPSYWY